MYPALASKQLKLFWQYSHQIHIWRQIISTTGLHYFEKFKNQPLFRQKNSSKKGLLKICSNGFVKICLESIGLKVLYDFCWYHPFPKNWLSSTTCFYIKIYSFANTSSSDQTSNLILAKFASNMYFWPTTWFFPENILKNVENRLLIWLKPPKISFIFSNRPKRFQRFNRICVKIGHRVHLLSKSCWNNNY